MINNLNTEIIEKLKQLNASGATPSTLLKYIRAELPEDNHIAVTCMKYFRSSFNLSLKQVSPILGWIDQQISDALINKFLSEEMDKIGDEL